MICSKILFVVLSMMFKSIKYYLLLVFFILTFTACTKKETVPDNYLKNQIVFRRSSRNRMTFRLWDFIHPGSLMLWICNQFHGINSPGLFTLLSFPMLTGQSIQVHYLISASWLTLPILTVWKFTFQLEEEMAQRISRRGVIYELLRYSSTLS